MIISSFLQSAGKIAKHYFSVLCLLPFLLLASHASASFYSDLWQEEKPALETEMQEPPVESNLVNINSDSIKEIAKGLKGIGKVKATAIVEYRQQNGNFSSKEQLLNVKGITPRLLRLNHNAIVLK